MTHNIFRLIQEIQLLWKAELQFRAMFQNFNNDTDTTGKEEKKKKKTKQEYC